MLKYQCPERPFGVLHFLVAAQYQWKFQHRKKKFLLSVFLSIPFTASVQAFQQSLLFDLANFRLFLFSDFWKDVNESFSNIFVTWNYFIIIYQTDLTRTKGFAWKKISTVCQKVSLSITLFVWRLVKENFFSFLKSFTENFLCLV